MSKERPSLTLFLRIKATPANVYGAWTLPALLVRWFGPDGGPVLSAEADPRVGGSFRVRFKTVDGESHECSGEYLEVEPDRKLAFTWQWISTPERRSLVSIAFRAIPEGTEMTFTHSQFYDEAARDGHLRGWTGSLARLQALLEEV